MVASVDAWYAERAAADEPPIQASFGLHYGPVVLGDIGENRLEFAVIGSTVNIASRLAALTREHDAVLVASGTLIDRTREEAKGKTANMDRFSTRADQAIRGIEEPMTVWTFA